MILIYFTFKIIHDKSFVYVILIECAGIGHRISKGNKTNLSYRYISDNFTLKIINVDFPVSDFNGHAVVHVLGLTGGQGGGQSGRIGRAGRLGPLGGLGLLLLPPSLFFFFFAFSFALFPRKKRYICLLKCDVESVVFVLISYKKMRN